jgi:hypothetical protein
MNGPAANACWVVGDPVGAVTTQKVTVPFAGPFRRFAHRSAERIETTLTSHAA